MIQYKVQVCKGEQELRLALQKLGKEDWRVIAMTEDPSSRYTVVLVQDMGRPLESDQR